MSDGLDLDEPQIGNAVTGGDPLATEAHPAHVAAPEHAGLDSSEIHPVPVGNGERPAPTELNGVPQEHEIQCGRDASEEGHTAHEAHATAALLAELREVHRMRQDLHRAEKSLTLQIKAIARRVESAFGRVKSTERVPNGDGGRDRSETHAATAAIADLASLPLQECLVIVHKARLKPELRMKHIVRQLPIYAWMESINGFGELGLAQILAETGDLSNYANPGKLWKRMGLAVIDGKRQRRVPGAEALIHGYSPIRRSIMYCIGDSMIKKQSPYRELYLAQKEKYQQREDLLDAKPIVHHRMAQRYMEKRLLKNLWSAWRANVGLKPQLRRARPDQGDGLVLVDIQARDAVAEHPDVA